MSSVDVFIIVFFTAELEILVEGEPAKKVENEAHTKGKADAASPPSHLPDNDEVVADGETIYVDSDRDDARWYSDNRRVDKQQIKWSNYAPPGAKLPDVDHGKYHRIQDWPSPDINQLRDLLNEEKARNQGKKVRIRYTLTFDIYVFERNQDDTANFEKLLLHVKLLVIITWPVPKSEAQSKSDVDKKKAGEHERGWKPPDGKGDGEWATTKIQVKEVKKGGKMDPKHKEALNRFKGSKTGKNGQQVKMKKPRNGYKPPK